MMLSVPDIVRPLRGCQDIRCKIPCKIPYNRSLMQAAHVAVCTGRGRHERLEEEKNIQSGSRTTIKRILNICIVPTTWTCPRAGNSAGREPNRMKNISEHLHLMLIAHAQSQCTGQPTNQPFSHPTTFMVTAVNNDCV